MEPVFESLPEDERPRFDEKAAARFLGNKPQTLAKWRTRSKGPFYHRLHGQIRYSKSDLIAFVKASRVDPALPSAKKSKSARTRKSKQKLLPGKARPALPAKAS